MNVRKPIPADWMAAKVKYGARAAASFNEQAMLAAGLALVDQKTNEVMCEPIPEYAIRP